MIQVQWLELKPGQAGIITEPPAQLELQDGSTVSEALRQIGVDSARISQLFEQRAVAVFGLYATEHTVLHAGDRIEILDALSFDPKESRRRRARHKTLTKRQKELAKHERRSRKQAKSSAEN